MLSVTQMYALKATQSMSQTIPWIKLMRFWHVRNIPGWDLFPVTLSLDPHSRSASLVASNASATHGYAAAAIRTIRMSLETWYPGTASHGHTEHMYITHPQRIMQMDPVMTRKDMLLPFLITSLEYCVNLAPWMSPRSREDWHNMTL